MTGTDRIAPYLDRVCRYLLWPPYRARVRRELTDHILSRAAMLREERGLEEEQAVREALGLLGDPDALGRALRHARFPLGRLLFGAATAVIWLAIAGCLLYLLAHLYLLYLLTQM